MECKDPHLHLLDANKLTLIPLRKQVYCFLKDALIWHNHCVAQKLHRDCHSQQEILLIRLHKLYSFNIATALYRSWFHKYYSTNKQRFFLIWKPEAWLMEKPRLFSSLHKALSGILLVMLLFAFLAPSQAQIIVHHNSSN